MNVIFSNGESCQSGIFRAVWRTWQIDDHISHWAYFLFFFLHLVFFIQFVFFIHQPWRLFVIISCTLWILYPFICRCDFILRLQAASLGALALLSSSFSFPTVSCFWPLFACIRYGNRLQFRGTCLHVFWPRLTWMNLVWLPEAVYCEQMFSIY